MGSITATPSAPKVVVNSDGSVKITAIKPVSIAASDVKTLDIWVWREPWYGDRSGVLQYSLSTKTGSVTLTLSKSVFTSGHKYGTYCFVNTKDGGGSNSSKSTSFIPKGSVYVLKNGTYNKEVAVFVKDNGVWKPVQAWAKTSYGKWQVI